MKKKRERRQVAGTSSDLEKDLAEQKQRVMNAFQHHTIAEQETPL